MQSSGTLWIFGYDRDGVSCENYEKVFVNGKDRENTFWYFINLTFCYGF